MLPVPFGIVADKGVLPLVAKPVHRVDLPAVLLLWYNSFTVHVVPKT